MFCLLLFVDHGMTGIILIEEEETTLQLLNAALRVSNKLTYTFWIQYFKEGKGRRKGVKVKAMLYYWLSRFILPSSPEDGVKTYVFPLAIFLVKEKKLSLGPLYLGSLIRSWMSANNILCSTAVTTWSY